jgi:hypothetical protein
VRGVARFLIVACLRDADVDLADLAALLSAYGTVPGDPSWNPACDFDADDDVGSSDLALLPAHRGEGG